MSVIKINGKELRISDNIVSAIGYCKMFKEYSEKIPEYKLTKNITLYNEDNKNYIIEELKKAVAFEIIDNVIEISYPLNDIEIKAQKAEYHREYLRFLEVVNSYYIKEEYQNTIKEYLAYKNLNYILVDLHKIRNLRKFPTKIDLGFPNHI